MFRIPQLNRVVYTGVFGFTVSRKVLLKSLSDLKILKRIHLDNFDWTGKLVDTNLVAYPDDWITNESYVYALLKNNQKEKPLNFSRNLLSLIQKVLPVLKD